MTTLPYNPMQGAYRNDPDRTHGAHNGKRLIVLGFGFDAVGALSMTDCMKIINACREPVAAADRVDFSEEIATIERLQADLGTRYTISGGEIMELPETKGGETTDELPF